MSRINMPADILSLASDLAVLGKDAERTCAGFSTDTALERLVRDLAAGKGKIQKLQRAVRAHLASEKAAERERVRLATAQHSNRAAGAVVAA